MIFQVNCDENEKQETVLAAHSTPRAADEAKIQTRTVNSQEVADEDHDIILLGYA